MQDKKIIQETTKKSLENLVKEGTFDGSIDDSRPQTEQFSKETSETHNIQIKQ